MSALGEEISRVHATGISLGDSKPDNAILDGSGRIWFVDLEQASESGTPAWDLAEFLYYCGHYTLRWGRMKRRNMASESNGPRWLPKSLPMKKTSNSSWAASKILVLTAA